MTSNVVIISQVSCGFLGFLSEITFSIQALPVEVYSKILQLQAPIYMLFGATRSIGLIKKALYSPLLRNGLMTSDHRGQN